MNFMNISKESKSLLIGFSSLSTFLVSVCLHQILQSNKK